MHCRTYTDRVQVGSSEVGSFEKAKPPVRPLLRMGVYWSLMGDYLEVQGSYNQAITVIIKHISPLRRAGQLTLGV